MYPLRWHPVPLRLQHAILHRLLLLNRQVGRLRKREIFPGLLSSRQAWSIGVELPVKAITQKRPDDAAGIAFGSISSYRRGTITPATPAFLSLNGVQAATIDQVNANLQSMLPGFAATGEKTLEVYYRLQLNKNISVSPDFQYIWSPGAVRPQPGIFVAGTRLNITF